MQNFSLPVYTLKTWKFENIHSMTVKFCMHRKKISLTGSGGNFLRFSIFIMNDPLLSGAKPHLWKNSHVNPSLTFFLKCHHEINAKACVPNGVFYGFWVLGLPEEQLLLAEACLVSSDQIFLFPCGCLSLCCEADPAALLSSSELFCWSLRSR